MSASGGRKPDNKSLSEESKNGDTDFIRGQFIQAIKAGDPYITDEEVGKIQIDFIDNRTLSPVEIGGTR